MHPCKLHAAREATGGASTLWLTFRPHLHPPCMRRRGPVPSAAACAPGVSDAATEPAASAAPAHTKRAGPDRQPATRVAHSPARPAGKKTRGGQLCAVWCKRICAHYPRGCVERLTMRLGPMLAPPVPPSPPPQPGLGPVWQCPDRRPALQLDCPRRLAVPGCPRLVAQPPGRQPAQHATSRPE